MRESSLEMLVGRYAKQRGCLYWKFTSPGNRGVPDRIIVAPNGNVLFMELKAKRGVVSPLQEHQCDQLRLRNANVCIVRDYGDAVEEIDLLCK